MMSEASAIQPSSAEEECPAADRRLWIGNLDLRITEYVLLKLVQKFGKPERFDFIYHTSGPDKGKPRGYSFVTYTSREIAEKAIRSLNGKMALSRRLIVHWANEKHEEEPKIAFASKPAASIAEETQEEPSQESTQSKIRAIEAKLQAMQRTQGDFGLSELPAAPPGTSRYSSVNTVKTTQSKPTNPRRRPFVPNNHRPRRR